MIVLLMLCTLGLLSGFLLMLHVRGCEPVPIDSKLSQESALPERSVAIIVPARNEENNLPRLLASIPPLPAIEEVVVVDDNSTDRTSAVAEEFGARVLQPGVPTSSFTGKTWACAQGVENTSAELLFFLDADTFFESDGCQNIFSVFSDKSDMALSILPFAITEHPYEELSLFFNLLMAFGAGGFGVFQPPRLFGQSLLLPRHLYETIGGHTSVSRYVLENFHLSHGLKAAHAQSLCLGGRKAFCMRMFPEGFSQLWYGWMKAFAAGAQSTDPRILSVAIIWLTALTTITLLLLLISPDLRLLTLVLYLLAACQIFYFARQIGTYRFLSCLLFPIPLIFFFILFAQSALRRTTNRSTSWRGRHV
jgi:4,4'-diaponeurosporenoate glycosyltransferase